MDSGLSTYLATNVCEDGIVAAVLESNNWQNVKHGNIYSKVLFMT